MPGEPGEPAEVLARRHDLHGAEGELYYEALAKAARRGAAVSLYDFKRLRETASRVLGPVVAARVDGLRAQVGTPWTRDHMDAALGPCWRSTRTGDQRCWRRPQSAGRRSEVRSAGCRADALLRGQGAFRLVTS
ncbi:hypothetical protein GCM10023334_083210 [Nonomuraea thailandensis]